ncbi:glycosyltransferase family 2 protein [Zavarzinella formosa]|uniref:glycosyltransferase family 2 protein n=1 Tax=Zavarzinella formosa TaxID=360055 RepID=UPI0002F6CC17|nr:glycosyltransferase family 2 protein [Zavarzinella formosa]
MKLSVITAFLNEAENLPVFRSRVSEVLGKLDCEAEIILVDDHSTDGGPAYSRQWATEDPRVTYLRLSKNCGSHYAFSAGLAQTTGDAAVLLAADLQDPPEAIPALMEKWREGFAVVWADRSGREGITWLNQLTSKIYYQVMRRIAFKDMPIQGADFLLLDRKVINVYNLLPERNTSFLALIHWLGFNQCHIEWTKEKRLFGHSKWSFRKKAKLFLDSIVAFSYLPIRVLSMAGILFSFLGMAYAVFIVINAILGNPNPGWSSLMVVTLLLGGFQLMSTGVLGEYLWRAFDQIRNRPRYIVEEIRSGGLVKSPDLTDYQTGRND